MSDETAEKRGAVAQGLTHAKTLGDVMRTWGVLALALLALSNPDRVKSWVRDAGIKKLLDIEFSEADAKTIETTQQELKDARLLIAQLSENLAKAQKALREGQPEGEESVQLARQLEQAAQSARTTSNQLGDALENVRPLAQKAAVVTGTATGEWAVIFGGDANLASAQYEVERAAKHTETDRDRLAIFFRDGSYRSLAKYGSLQEAQDALKRFQKLRASAYVISLDRWCGKWKKEDGFFRCS